nr:GNAT family N-acetyltransferase [Pseudoruegeria sp. HB172150]
MTLRPHIAADFADYAAFLASDRASFMGGPHDTDVAWGWFTSDIAQWSLFGFGGLAITDRFTGEVFGQISIIKPPRWIEPEIGWLLYDAAEGKSIAYEAAVALCNHGFAELGLSTLVSYIDPGNTRSRTLAERLGGVLDPDVARPDPEDVVYRYPAPEARQ